MVTITVPPDLIDSLVETHPGSDPANAFQILDRFRELVNAAGAAHNGIITVTGAVEATEPTHDDRPIFWDDPVQRRGLAALYGGYRPDHYDYHDGPTGPAAESFVASSRR